MRYAYLGPEGTFSEAAVARLAEAGRRLGVEAEPVPCATIGATLEAVRTGAAERAVVPIESSVEGIVTATVDDLAGGDLLIVRETRLPIEFALLAREGATLTDVKTVGGHPQAEAQCRRWLAASLPGREWVAFASNAEAAGRAGGTWTRRSHRRRRPVGTASRCWCPMCTTDRTRSPGSSRSGRPDRCPRRPGPIAPRWRRSLARTTRAP